MSDNDGFGISNDSSVEDTTKLEPPKQYKVILHNDDYTPMEFVIELLIEIFSKSELQATEIMLNVHHRGQGICGIYPYEIAESKLIKIHERAKEREVPLRATMEKE
ncbi:MAG: ATP-dependent Clp protease adaptor ClpS [Proteobacteria bacterium]|nr:ATP-dependent Clp protease adaptor ClpS [Pseudomonadota bacterium]